MPTIPRVVVSGLRGGSGKTTLSVGLASALSSRSLVVAPFKKGPDYIDSGWLAAATGRACHNLDPFLIGDEWVLPSFLLRSKDADVAVIEGNRGLFDGMDSKGTLSTAQVARVVKAPVIIIVDCTKATRTIASMVYGAKRFERGVYLAGVVLNMLGSSRQEEVVRESIESQTGVPVVGAIPRLSASVMPERHMGLTPWQEHPQVERAVREAEELIVQYVNVTEVLRIARSAPMLSMPRKASRALKSVPRPVGPAPVVGVVRDSAFQFYYPENIEEISKRGAQVLEFSALKEKELPAVDALYIGGGFPETHAIALADNRFFRESLRRAVQDGMPVYAECGGLMYLGEEIRLEGKSYPMAGVYPLTFTLEPKPRAHGYTELKVVERNPFVRRGTVFKGHEFRYSEPIGADKLMEPAGSEFSFVFEMRRGRGIAGGRDGILYRNALATYTHLHATGSAAWAEGIVKAAAAYSAERRKRAESSLV
jgi:cobyrinic acid a,c-diamide synthase